jgi:hypothetical protein
VLVGTGDTSAAIHRLTLGIAALRSTGATLYLPWFLSNLARAYGDLQQLDNAWRCIAEARTLIQVAKKVCTRLRSIASPAKSHCSRRTLMPRKLKSISGMRSPSLDKSKPKPGNSAPQRVWRVSGATMAKCSKRANCWLWCMGGSRKGLARAI